MINWPEMARTAEMQARRCREGECAGREAEERRGEPLGIRLGWVFLVLVSAVVVGTLLGEQLGLARRIPPWLAVAAVLAGGYPVFLSTVRSLLRGRISSYALMSLGVAGALGAGEYRAAVLIVFFMRVAERLESYTISRSRRAVRSLLQMAPEKAVVLRQGREVTVAPEELRPGERVVVRPGEKIPADGRVRAGRAYVDQSPVTGESAFVEKVPGSRVFAGTIAHGGTLEVEVERVGAETTFGRVVRLVEEAEKAKAPVQLVADRFTAWYIPVVLGVAGITYLGTQKLSSALAVLLVACACAIALATPTAVIAAVGQAARRGILIKGGKYLELLARVDTVVMDKTGTVTRGRPVLSGVVAASGFSPEEVLFRAAQAESRSEHPAARAVVEAARARGMELRPPAEFEALPGMGVKAGEVMVGSRQLLEREGIEVEPALLQAASSLEEEGKTVFFTAWGERATGILAVADELRPEVPEVLETLGRLGVKRFYLLSGDAERPTRMVARALGVDYRAGLLPEEKIAFIRALQEEGRVVLMVGDGVNDAPALVQADVGVAMGAAGTDAALEAAPVVLMGDDWRALPAAILTGRRAFRVIRQNLALGVIYNAVGLTLAALGLLPPVLAAAGQSVPDFLIMLSSARLLRDPGPGR